MRFVEPDHIYADDLQKEAEELKNYILQITGNRVAGLVDDVNDDITVVFNDVDLIKYQSSISDFESIRRKLDLPLAHDEDEDEEGARNVDNYNEIRDSILRLIDAFENREDNPNLGEPLCGEALLWIFDESRWPDDSGMRDIIRRIRDVILNSYAGGRVLANYDHDKKEITLYTRWYNNYGEYVSAFAHEYFHAVHHYYLEREGSTENLSKYYHAVVLESLAEFFQITYLEERGFTGAADESKQVVLRHSPIFYPYSGCVQKLLGQGRVGRYDFNLFNQVFIKSSCSFKDTLYLLVDVYTADIIMKKKNWTSRRSVKTIATARGRVVPGTPGADDAASQGDLDPGTKGIVGDDTASGIDTRRVAEIVRSDLIPLLQRPEFPQSIIDGCLCHGIYSNAKFGVSLRFPVLIKVVVPADYKKRFDAAGIPRYYADMYEIHGEKFLLTSQWYERNKDPLNKWIEAAKIVLP